MGVRFLQPLWEELGAHVGKTQDRQNHGGGATSTTRDVLLLSGTKPLNPGHFLLLVQPLQLCTIFS